MSQIFKLRSRRIAEEIARRQSVKQYQLHPEEWVRNRLKERPENIYWDQFGGYENHKWDGTPNPFATAFEALANKEWVGIESATSVGKCYAEGTMCRMFDGSLKAVEFITTGDVLLGLDGTPRTVVSNYFGYDNLYKVEQEKGIDYTVNSQHLLCLKKRSWGGNAQADKIEIPAKYFVAQKNEFKRIYGGYRMKGIYPSAPVPIHPYFLGLWLGDGDSNNTIITTGDAEIVSYLDEFAKQFGCTISPILQPDKCPKYAIINKKGEANPIREILRELNVFKNKHIPDCYLYNSEEVRLQLLAGLTDSDGYKGEGNRGLAITQKRKRLVEQAQELAWSLGFNCSFYTGQKGIKARGFKGEYHQIYITGAGLEKIPTILKRKQFELDTRENLDISTLTVTAGLVGKYYGFTLDGDGLFFLRDYTVAHNTHFLPRVLFWFLDTYPNSLVVTTAPKKEQLRRVLWNEVANAFASFKAIRPYAELYTLNLTVDARSKTVHMKKNEMGMLERDLSSVGHEAIGIVAGVGAGEESATKMQGFHREHMLFIVEEAAGVHSAVITAIINTSTAENNLILAVGNPDSELDSLHTFCQLKKVRHIRISGYDHPNVVNNKTLIPGAVTTQSIEFRKEEYGEESPFFKSRGRGIAPTEATDSLIKSEYFDQCCEGSESFINIKHDLNSRYNSVGVDVANSESGDKAALAWGKGNMLDYLHEFHCSNATHLAYNLIFDDVKCAENNYKIYSTRKLSDYQILQENIGVDGVGIGIATVNAFYDNGFACTSLLGGALQEALAKTDQGDVLYDFANLRAQMYFMAREDLRTGQIIISKQIDKKIVRELKRELIAIKYKIQGGKIQVEGKEDIKKRLGGKSPNRADAFVYWNWVSRGYYNNSMHLPFA